MKAKDAYITLDDGDSSGIANDSTSSNQVPSQENRLLCLLSSRAQNQSHCRSPSSLESISVRSRQPSCLGDHEFWYSTVNTPHLSALDIFLLTMIPSGRNKVMGECSKDTAFEILDHFYSQAGNFIDTANQYQLGQSEEWLGEWFESRGDRGEMF